MTRTQAPVGRSLAQLYDVEGSQLAGSAEINDHEISPVHELGGQIFAERARMGFRDATTGAIAQNIEFAIDIEDLPSFHKILGFFCHIGVGDLAKVSYVWLSVANDEATELRCPFYHWATATGTSQVIDVGGGNSELLVPGAVDAALFSQRSFVGVMPRPAQRRSAQPAKYVMHGASAGFGAGVTTIACRLWFAFWDRSAGGLLPPGAAVPLPSW